MQEEEDQNESFFEKWYRRGKQVGIARIFLCVIAGVFLLVLSFPGDKKVEKEIEKEEVKIEENQELSTYLSNLEDKLKKVLSNVEGIGEVEVMITAKTSKEKVTLKDTPYNRKDTKEQDSGGGTRENTEISSEESSVMEKAEDGSESPYITKEVQPEIEGVVVIAKGAKNQQVISEINDAVVALFNVPSHKIKVMKMK